MRVVQRTEVVVQAREGITAEGIQERLGRPPGRGSAALRRGWRCLGMGTASACGPGEGRGESARLRMLPLEHERTLSSPKWDVKRPAGRR